MQGSTCIRAVSPASVHRECSSLELTNAQIAPLRWSVQAALACTWVKVCSRRHLTAGVWCGVKLFASPGRLRMKSQFTQKLEGIFNAIDESGNGSSDEILQKPWTSSGAPRPASTFNGTLKGTPNTRPQECSRNRIGIYLPLSYVPNFFLQQTWGSLCGVLTEVSPTYQ